MLENIFHVNPVTGMFTNVPHGQRNIRRIELQHIGRLPGHQRPGRNEHDFSFYRPVGQQITQHSRRFKPKPVKVDIDAGEWHLGEVTEQFVVIDAHDRNIFRNSQPHLTRCIDNADAKLVIKRNDPCRQFNPPQRFRQKRIVQCAGPEIFRRQITLVHPGREA